MDDQESWRSFFDLYWKLLYNVARRSGLEDDAAQDVVQETVISVARAMPSFRYDPARGSFKQWLLRIVRRRIVDQLRRTYRAARQRADIPLERLDDDDSVAIADRPGGIEDAWNAEWEQTIFEAALARVRQAVQPRHFQIFDYCVLKGWRTSRVAETLGVSAAQVYLAKHRVSQAMKRAVREINENRTRGHLT